jgi:hypothetical protein
MKKSIRTLALSAVVVFSAAPVFANPMGTNPRPQIVSISPGDYFGILLSVVGL